MADSTVDFRTKWRMRRRRLRLRQVLVALAVLASVVVAACLILGRRLPQFGEVAWSVAESAGGVPHIGVGPGVLVATWEPGVVQAYGPATGRRLWRAPFGRAHGPVGPPAVGPDSTVFGSGDGNVWCLDLRTGVDRWHYRARAICRSTPLIVGDRVFVGADDGRLYALALADGQLAWAYPALVQADRQPILGGPVAVASVIVCGSADRSAVGLDGATGRLLWRRPVGSPVIARATAAGDRAYVAAEDGVAWCLQAATGKVLWTAPASALLRFPIPISADGRAFLVATDRTVRCVNALTGAPLWRRVLPARPTTSPTAEGARLYVGLSNGSVVALSHGSGRTLWHWQAGAKPLGDIVLGAGHLFCTTNTGRIFAVRLPPS